MKKETGFRLLVTFYTLAWLLILAGFMGFLMGIIAPILEWRFAGMGLPALTADFAIPMIGGLGRRVLDSSGVNGPTWVTFVGWGVLYLWPLANLVFVWRCRDHDRARWRLLYSSAGYGLFFFAAVLVVAVGLTIPFVPL